MSEGYAVFIPTRGRNAHLMMTVVAIMASKFPPSVIILVDNNDEPDTLRSEESNIIVVRNETDRKTDAAGSQIGLDWAASLGFETAVKWDDDLVPKPDCLGRLVNHVECGDTVAAGGLYPKDGEKRKTLWDKSSRFPITADGDTRHIQFFEVDPPCKVDLDLFYVRSLYSSFAFDVAAAFRIGGFHQGYSKHSFRHETDFTLRLNEADPELSMGGVNLIVDPQAVAIHRCLPGGVRGFDQKAAMEMRKSDQALFQYRLKTMKIDSEYWKVTT